MILSSEIFKAVTAVTEVSAEEILSPSRSQRIFWARWLVVSFLKREHPHWSNLDIAMKIGRKEATSVHYALHGIHRLLEMDPRFQRLHQQTAKILYPVATLP